MNKLIKLFIIALCFALGICLYAGQETQDSSLGIGSGADTTYSAATVIQQAEPEYEVDMLVVTPCLPTGCYNFNEEILDQAVDFYKEYGITINFDRTTIDLPREVTVDVGPYTNPITGFEVKLELARLTDDANIVHILHAPMFVGYRPDSPSSHILGVANAYLELIVLKQQYIDVTDTEWELHILIHEIGHIFGLEDHYEGNCDIMDGTIEETNAQASCRVFTPEQVSIMHTFINEHH